MRSKNIGLTLLMTGLLLGCRKDQPNAPAPKAPVPAPAQKADGLCRFHSDGVDRLGSDTNAARWSAMEALPATRELEQHILENIAKAPKDLLTNRLVFRADDHSQLIQPLLGDLLHAESVAEMRGLANQPAEFVLAVRLNDDRAQIWKTNLSIMLGSWTGMKPVEFQAENVTGWELKKHHNPNLIRFVHVGQWVVFGFGQDKLPLQDEL